MCLRVQLYGGGWWHLRGLARCDFSCRPQASAVPDVTQCPPLRSQSEHVAGDKIFSLPRLFGSAWILLCTWLCTSRVSYQGGLELCLGLKAPKGTQVEPLAGVWCVCNATSISLRIKCLPHPNQQLFGDRMCVVYRGDA